MAKNKKDENPQTISNVEQTLNQDGTDILKRIIKLY